MTEAPQGSPSAAGPWQVTASRRKKRSNKVFLDQGSGTSGHESVGTGPKGHVHEIIHQQELRDTFPMLGTGGPHRGDPDPGHFYKKCPV